MATNRVIFYGGALQGAQDKIYTPVNDLLPGVFVHAMAMDNLITFHGRPQQNVVSVGGTVLDSNPGADPGGHTGDPDPLLVPLGAGSSASARKRPRTQRDVRVFHGEGRREGLALPGLRARARRRPSC